MMNIREITRLNDEAALEAAANDNHPFLVTAANKAAAMDGWLDDWNIPHLGDYVPPGWRRVSLSDKISRRGISRDLDAFFVDSTDMGQPDEPALTLAQFVASVEPGFGYAVISAGQFQVHVGKYERRPTEVEPPSPQGSGEGMDRFLKSGGFPRD